MLCVDQKPIQCYTIWGSLHLKDKRLSMLFSLYSVNSNTSYFKWYLTQSECLSYWDHNGSAPPHAKPPLITRKSVSFSHSLKVCLATSINLREMFSRDLTSSYVNVTKTVFSNKPIWDFYSFWSNTSDFEYFFCSFFNLAASLLILTPDLHLILFMSIANTISFLKECLCSHDWG